MEIRRTEDCWITIDQNRKWPDRLGYTAFTTEKKARTWIKKLGCNCVGVALVCIPVTFTLENPRVVANGNA
jgi:hypothetical protein